MERISRLLSDWLGRPSAFILAGILPIIVWALWGPIAHYSDTWQLVINTGTTVLTYLFMFLIQRAQNGHSFAIQVKLDELIRAATAARNEVIRIEEKSDEEMQQIRTRL